MLCAVRWLILIVVTQGKGLGLGTQLVVVHKRKEGAFVSQANHN